MKTMPRFRRPTRWPLGLAVLVMAGLLWLIERVGLPTGALSGFRVGIVISGFCVIWLWLLATSPRRGAATRHWQEPWKK